MISEENKEKLNKIFATEEDTPEKFIPLTLYTGSLFDKKFYPQISDISLTEFRAMLGMHQSRHNETKRIIIPAHTKDLIEIDNVFSELQRSYENHSFGSAATLWDIDELKDDMIGALMVDVNFNIYKTIFMSMSKPTPYFIYRHYYILNLNFDEKKIKKLIKFHKDTFKGIEKMIDKFNDLSLEMKLIKNFKELY